MGEAETEISSVGTAGAATSELHLGDAIHFFLSAKRAGGRSERTLDDYRKKLELVQRWLAVRVGGEGAVDAPYIDIGADEIEAYVVHLRDGRGMSDSSRKNHLAVLRSFFQTVSKRMKIADPTKPTHRVCYPRVHQRWRRISPRMSLYSLRVGE